MAHQVGIQRVLVLAAACVAAVLIAASLPVAIGQEQKLTSDSRAEGLAAFGGVAQVLRNPRCLNCHPTDNSPRQGDDRHTHANLVRRGPDDHGAVAMACGTCHQSQNNEASGVPGRPNWHLAPLSMGWEGLSDHDLCETLKDPRRNGGRDLAALTEHMRNDHLIDHGWDPGANRKPIPIPREELVRLMETWARDGAPCPSLPSAVR